MISIEKLQQTLFIDYEDFDDFDIQLEKSEMHKDMFHSPFITASSAMNFSFTTPTRHANNANTVITSEGLSVPSFLYYSTEWLVDHCFNPLRPELQHIQIFERTPSTQRLKEISSLVENKGVIPAIRSLTLDDSVEISFMILEYLKKKSCLLKRSLHGALKGTVLFKNKVFLLFIPTKKVFFLSTKYHQNLQAPVYLHHHQKYLNPF